jgi:hypothetical protein
MLVLLPVGDLGLDGYVVAQWRQRLLLPLRPLGSVVNLASSTGTTEWTSSYEPTGAIHSQTSNDTNAPLNPLKFIAEYNDPTGL